MIQPAGFFSFQKGEPMRIIYRMRGLLGDATEEFIESLDSTTGRVQIQLFLAFLVENKLVSCVSLVLFCWLCIFFALIGMHN